MTHGRGMVGHLAWFVSLSLFPGLSACGHGGGGHHASLYDVVAGNRDLDTVLIYYDVFAGTSSQTPDVTLDNAGSQIDLPRTMVISNNRLVVGCEGSDKILIFDNFLGLTSFQAPNVVLDTAGSLIHKPKQVLVTPLGDLVSISSDNDTILIWHSFATITSSQAPSVVLDAGGSTLGDPSGIAVVGDDLYVGNYSNNDVLVFKSINTLANSDPPDIVLDNGGSGVDHPQKVIVAGDVLYDCQPFNSRIRVFNGASALVNFQAASAVLDSAGSLLDNSNSAVRIGNSLFVASHVGTTKPTVLRFDNASTLVNAQAPSATLDGTAGIPGAEEVLQANGVLFVSIQQSSTTLGGVAIYKNPLSMTTNQAPDLLLNDPLILKRTVGLAVQAR